MSTVNDIEVTIADGFITIKNTNNPNASIENYNLLNVTSVNEYYQDYTALEDYQKGRFEHLEEFSVILDIEENPTDLVKIEFDVQDVTNQAGWTADRAGLAQAITDIKTGVTSALSAANSPSVSTDFTPGRKVVAVAGTAEPLVGVVTTMTKVDITALSTNTDAVVYGNSTVVAAILTRVGNPLEPGDSTTVLMDDLSKVFIDSMVDGEGVTFNYFID